MNRHLAERTEPARLPEGDREHQLTGSCWLKLTLQPAHLNVSVNTNPEATFAYDRSRPRICAAQAYPAIVSKSPAIRGALARVALVAPTNTTVLLQGETGVGKEVFAQAIHDASPRRRRPMVRVNAAVIPAALFESELLGHERGAFTDARSRRIGRVEAAKGSTLFLDEISELSPEVQVKLLRILEDRTIERLGSNKSITLDVRIIAATNRDLKQAVRNGQFREDLYYRLNVFPITVAPLRERREDIPDLARTFIDEFARSYGKTIESIAPESLSELQQYFWPGNIRELRNVIEQAMILAKSSTLTPEVPRARSQSFSGSTRRYSVHGV